LIATAATSLIDGPLPITKIWSVVSVAWTGYELAELQPAYRSAVRTSLMESLQATGNDIGVSSTNSKVQMANSFDGLLLEIRSQSR
jgi:hypothetical protein